MRVVVTGAAGQLGSELVAVLGAAGHDVVAAGRPALDVTDRDQVVGALTTLSPDAVVHAAAWTDVDGCELDPARAVAVNALGTRHVADACRRTGARLCYVSTDYVFDGTKDGPYDEWDVASPLSAYGRSKLGGEREAETLCPDATVVRTSWLFGAHGHNIVKTVLSLAERDGELRFVDDQLGCPTAAADLAGTIASLVVARLPGRFHVTNAGATTWFGLARAVVGAAGGDAARVVPVRTDELRPTRPAPRPANSVLDNAALRACGIPLLSDWHDPVERLVKELTAS